MRHPEADMWADVYKGVGVNRLNRANYMRWLIEEQDYSTGGDHGSGECWDGDSESAFTKARPLVLRGHTIHQAARRELGCQSRGSFHPTHAL
jgi:hypothetical protein